MNESKEQPDISTVSKDIPISPNNAESQSDARWLNNEGVEVERVFGFNENAELINGRAAMIGFLMLVITEMVFRGTAATQSVFGIG